MPATRRCRKTCTLAPPGPGRGASRSRTTVAAGRAGARGRWTGHRRTVERRPLPARARTPRRETPGTSPRVGESAQMAHDPAGRSPRVGTDWRANVTSGATRRATRSVTFARHFVPTRAYYPAASGAGGVRPSGWPFAPSPWPLTPWPLTPCPLTAGDVGARALGTGAGAVPGRRARPAAGRGGRVRCRRAPASRRRERPGSVAAPGAVDVPRGQIRRSCVGSAPVRRRCVAEERDVGRRGRDVRQRRQPTRLSAAGGPAVGRTGPPGRGGRPTRAVGDRTTTLRGAVRRVAADAVRDRRPHGPRCGGRRCVPSSPRRSPRPRHRPGQAARHLEMSNASADRVSSTGGAGDSAGASAGVRAGPRGASPSRRTASRPPTPAGLVGDLGRNGRLGRRDDGGDGPVSSAEPARPDRAVDRRRPAARDSTGCGPARPDQRAGQAGAGSGSGRRRPAVVGTRRRRVEQRRQQGHPQRAVERVGVGSTFGDRRLGDVRIEGAARRPPAAPRSPIPEVPPPSPPAGAPGLGR